MKKSIILNSVMIACVMIFAACGSDDDNTTPAGTGGTVGAGGAAGSGGGEENLVPDIASTYASIVFESYSDSLSAAQDLDTAIQAFVAAPTEATLTAAKDAWLASREPYLQTEVYRFYNGPIDNEETGPEGLLNAWPLDEVFIDYVEGNAEAGIVNDASVTIDATTLESKNEEGGDANIATGYHAIEFLLWGQDQSADGPGNRPYTDYIEGEGGTASNQGRRAQYLTTVSTMLVGHLEGLRAAWAPNSTDNYRASFEGADGTEAIQKIMTGMVILAGFETGGERLQTALDSGDQEDEHSCFSDNTHRDMIQDIQGVKNVYEGAYGSVEGPGIRDYIAATNGTLANEIGIMIDNTLAAANELPVPFDQAITTDDGKAKVGALVTACLDLEAQLQVAFRELGFEVPVAE